MVTHELNHLLRIPTGFVHRDQRLSTQYGESETIKADAFGDLLQVKFDTRLFGVGQVCFRLTEHDERSQGCAWFTERTKYVECATEYKNQNHRAAPISCASATGKHSSPTIGFPRRSNFGQWAECNKQKSKKVHAEMQKGAIQNPR